MTGKTGEPFEIGIATVDITPPLGVAMAGYGPRKGVAESVGHPLRAEALVCRDGKDAWALVTSDVIGYPREMVERVRADAAGRTGLAPEAILISGTHTHSGPAAMRVYKSELTDVDHRYREDLEKKLAELVASAWEACEPGHFEVAGAEAPGLASNRRVVADDGTATNEWVDAEGKHTGYYDPSVLLVGVARPGGWRDALLVNYGCHPVTLGPRSLALSPDYPGYTKDLVESRSSGMTVLFALAGAGNINPRVCIQVGAEYPKQMGERLGEIVLRAMGDLQPASPGPVASSRRPWRLVSRRRWPEGSPRKTGEEIETEILAVRAGDLAMLALPGELFSEYTARFRQAGPVPHTLVISIANDSVGYLPTDEGEAQGGHEINGRAGDAIEEPLTRLAGEAMRDLAD